MQCDIKILKRVLRQEKSINRKTSFSEEGAFHFAELFDKWTAINFSSCQNFLSQIKEKGKLRNRMKRYGCHYVFSAETKDYLRHLIQTLLFRNTFPHLSVKNPDACKYATKGIIWKCTAYLHVGYAQLNSGIIKLMRIHRQPRNRKYFSRDMHSASFN